MSDFVLYVYIHTDTQKKTEHMQCLSWIHCAILYRVEVPKHLNNLYGV